MNRLNALESHPAEPDQRLPRTTPAASVHSARARLPTPAGSGIFTVTVTQTRPRFHLALPVTDLQSAREFYVGLLGCHMGRSAERWIDFDFFGHQLSVHLVDQGEVAVPTNPVDGDDVPAQHFGVILDVPAWTALAARLDTAGVEFLIRPHVRFVGEPGEQSTLFLRDPSGNALEFKAFREDAAVFRR